MCSCAGGGGDSEASGASWCVALFRGWDCEREELPDVREVRIDMTEGMAILFRECEAGGDYDHLCQFVMPLYISGADI